MRGFTLVELVVVLAILALAYGLIAPSIGGVIAQGDLRVGQRELTAALREARSLAVTDARDVRFVLDGAAGSYGVGPQRHALARGMALAAAVPESRRLSTRVAVIDFFPDGTSTGGEVVLTAGGATATIAVDWLTGRVGAVP